MLSSRKPGLILCLLWVLVGACLSSVSTAQTRTKGEVPDQAVTTCPITEPMSPDDPDAPRNGNFGNNSISTILGSRLNFRPGGPGWVLADGALGMKYMWWRTKPGTLSVEGNRLDDDAPPLRAHIPPGYGDEGFQASTLIFPTPGCWRVTAHVGGADLSFVVSVNLIGDGPCSRESANVREVRGEVQTMSVHKASDEDTTFVRVRGERKYSGSGIKGVGDYDLLQVEMLRDSSIYVGYERISGFVDGKRGTFVVRHEGEIVEGISRSKWQVVESSGTDELRHVQGQGTYSSGLDDMGCYSFERTAL